MRASKGVARQAGAAMVEAAIVIGIFMMVVIGILELSFYYYMWNRTGEAARDGLRFSIVNTPMTSSGTLATCPAPDEPVDCSGGTCAALITRMQVQAPWVQPGNVALNYACSSAGNPALPPELQVHQVSLTVSGIPQTLMGFPGVAELPAVTVARTGEDLSTP